MLALSTQTIRVSKNICLGKAVDSLDICGKEGGIPEVHS